MAKHNYSYLSAKSVEVFTKTFSFNTLSDLAFIYPNNFLIIWKKTTPNKNKQATKSTFPDHVYFFHVNFFRLFLDG